MKGRGQGGFADLPINSTATCQTTVRVSVDQDGKISVATNCKDISVSVTGNTIAANYQASYKVREKTKRGGNGKGRKWWNS